MVTWEDYLLAVIALGLAIAAGIWRARRRVTRWPLCQVCKRWPAPCFTYWRGEGEGKAMRTLHRCRGCVHDGSVPEGWR